MPPTPRTPRIGYLPICVTGAPVSMAKHPMGRDSQSNRAQTIAVFAPTERMPQELSTGLVDRRRQSVLLSVSSYCWGLRNGARTTDGILMAKPADLAVPAIACAHTKTAGAEDTPRAVRNVMLGDSPRTHFASSPAMMRSLSFGPHTGDPCYFPGSE